MTVRLEYETIHAIAEAAMKGVVDGGDDLATVAVETLVGADDPDNVFDYAMLLIGAARRTMAPAPPYIYTGLTLHGSELAATSDVDDIVLTLLSRGFGGKAAADLEGVRMALGDAERRGRLVEVLLRVAAVAGGLASLDEFRQGGHQP